MEETQLRVRNASVFNIGRGIITLNPTTLLKLQLSPGDIVEIRGKKKTAAIAWEAERQNCDQDLVRIDHFIQQNAGVSIGGKVTIKKVEAPEAKKLILALSKSITKGEPELQFGERANEIIKRHVLKRPVFRGDIIPIIDSMSQPITESLTTSQTISLVVVETDPSNTIVKVSKETTIELSSKPVKYHKSPEENKEPVSKLANDSNQTLEPHNLAITNAQKEITITPSVFEIPKKPNVPNCVSVLMPFSTEFDDVYGCINDACYEVGMSCHKADDFWHHSAIIQDIFELIFRSSFVIVDFTGKNPNVFYEAGIAHVLGKTVLPITQSSDDIPFDLRHHRYILYHNDREGLKKLKRELVSKLNFEKNRE